MRQEHDSEGGVVDILIGVGLLAVATYLYLNDPRGGDDEDDWSPGDDEDDWSPGNGGGPGNGPDDDLRSSYPPWEDAMNHRYPGSYGSRTGG